MSRSFRTNLLQTLRCPEIFSFFNGYKTIRASFGHSGLLLLKMNWGKFVPYNGSYNLFCLSHTTFSGLGALSAKRKVNVLTIPERCENRGAKGFIDIRKSKFLFWSQVGDRYGNKIFCFDPELKFDYVQYIDDYNSPQRIKLYMRSSLDSLIRINRISEEKAIERLQKLFITICDEDENENEDDCNY